MPRGPLPDEIQRFLAAPRPAVVAWLRDDGGPTTAELAVHYTGEPYTDHETPSVAVTAVVERWHTFGEL